MSKLIPIVAGATGTAIIGVGGGYLLSTQNTTTIKNKFKDAIIDFATESTLINEKFAKLKKDDSDPKHPKLKSIKAKERTNPNSSLEEFKQTCQAIYDSNFSSKDDDTFKDFQSFCARTVKDKISVAEWATERAVWKTRFDKLNNDGTKPVSSELQEIASKTSQNGEELKNWCSKTADLVFEGNENANFKDAKVSCGKND